MEEEGGDVAMEKAEDGTGLAGGYVEGKRREGEGDFCVDRLESWLQLRRTAGALARALRACMNDALLLAA